MQPLTDRLGLPRERSPRVLVLSPHADDAEIGAAGTIARLVAERPDATLTWLVLAASDVAREQEARRSADALLAGAASSSIDVRRLRDGFLPYEGSSAKEALLEHGPDDPDLILGPRRDDAHQDHRLVAELTTQVFRGATVLEYELPKWDGDLGPANVYVPLSTTTFDEKVDHLITTFPSQHDRVWFRADTFRAIARLRGVECRAPDGLAEAFVCRKLIV